MEAGYLRRSIRLQGRDYAFPGAYFVTICSHEQRHIFGTVRDSRLIPSELGRLVRECWVAIPLHFAQVDLKDFEVMPNHLHGLISITRKVTTAPAAAAAATAPATNSPPSNWPPSLVGAQHCCALPPDGFGQAEVKPHSLGAIMRSFKSIVARRAHEELRWKGPIWQRNYFERLLRDGKEFAEASRYIAENPRRWEWDRENPERRMR